LVTYFAQTERELESAMSAIDSDIRLIEGRLAKANASREACYAALAGIFLGHGTDAAGPVSEVTQELQAIFDKRSARRAEIDDNLQKARAQRNAARDELQAARANADAATLACDAAATRLEKFLDADPDCSKLTASCVEAAAALARAEENARTIQDECSQKSAAFEGDRIFRYLKGRTVEGRFVGGVSGRIDSWIAAVSDFRENDRRYEILCALPDYAAKRVAECESRLAAAKAAVATFRRDAEAREGIPALASGKEKAVAEVARLKALSDQIAKDLETMEGERAQIDRSDDPFLAKAKARIRNCLEGDTIARLRERAIKTAEEDDDRLVDQIEALETEINTSRTQASNLRKRRRELEDQAKQVRTAHQTFERRYTGSYDQFDPGLDINSMLRGYIAGSIAETVFWGSLQRHYYDATPQSPAYFGGGGGNSGNFGGGGFDGGSSFGGGGGGSGSSFGGGN
jgi:chromosome segregation ATPase